MVREELIIISAVDEMTLIIIWYMISACAHGCVEVLWSLKCPILSRILWHPPWFDFQQHFPRQSGRVEGVCVCVCWSLGLVLCAWVSFRTQTVPILSHYRDRWAAVTERAGCMHVMDHCSRARRCRFSLWHFFHSVSISPASWSEVVLQRLSARPLGACKLLFDISGFFFR